MKNFRKIQALGSIQLYSSMIFRHFFLKIYLLYQEALMKIQIYYYSTYIYFPDEFEGFELQILIKRNNITKVNKYMAGKIFSTCLIAFKY